MKALIASVLAGGLLASCAGTATSRLNAGGATFPASMYQAWISQHGGMINYQPTGSGAGVRAFNDGVVDFAGTDKPVADRDIQRELLHVPATGGAIVPAYNNPSCDVTMTQQELADVFLGNIDNWAYFGCDDLAITVVHRSDGSGTTAAFTSSLSAFSDEWKERVGSGKAVSWIVGIGAKGNSGVAAQLIQLPGAIGYLNYGYVLNTNLQQVELQNAAGNFVVANAETSAAGLSEIVLDDQLRGSNPNPGGENSYPIVTLTWIIVNPEHPKNEQIKEFLYYILTAEAQSMADSLGYVPLPESIMEQARAVVDTLK